VHNGDADSGNANGEDERQHGTLQERSSNVAQPARPQRARASASASVSALAKSAGGTRSTSGAAHAADHGLHERDENMKSQLAS
jgi:hypothetical protein